MSTNTEKTRTLSEELILKIKLVKNLILKRRSQMEWKRINRELKRAADKSGIDIELVDEGRKK